MSEELQVGMCDTVNRTHVAECIGEHACLHALEGCAVLERLPHGDVEVVERSVAGEVEAVGFGEDVNHNTCSKQVCE